MTTLLDTNILIRHFTQDSPDRSRRATAFLASPSGDELLLLDLVAAEAVFVLETVYRQTRHQIVELLRSVLALPAIQCDSKAVLHRSIELYEGGADWTDAYLAAVGEQRGIPAIASFDRGMPRVPGIQRIEPPEV